MTTRITLAAAAFAAALPAQAFEPWSGLHVDQTTQLLAALDLDGDGDDEVVSARTNGTEVTVLQSHGNGAFHTGQRVSTTGVVRPGISGGRVGDLDGDSDLDLIAGSTSGGVIVLENRGGQLVLGAQIRGGFPVTATIVSLADLDGDRDLDLVLVSSTLVSILDNDGLGNFTPTARTMPPRPSNVVSATVADLDGNGHQDLVLARISDLTIWMGNPTAFLDETTQRVPPASAALFLSAVAVDADQDGDLDLVGTRATGQRYFQFRNDGTGRFTDNSTAMPAGGGPMTVAFAVDFDGQSGVDVVFGGQLLRNSGTGVYTTGPAFSSVLSMACDVDGNGMPDLLGANQLLRNLGNGTFEAHTQAVAASAGDFDGDGDADLMSTDARRWAVEGGHLVLLPPVPVISQPTGTRPLGDLDGDGDIDLVAGAATNVQIFANVGNAAFAAATVLPVAVPSSLALGDLDGDLDLDLVVLDHRAVPGPSVHVFANGGNLQFTEVSNTALPTMPATAFGNVHLADADADGRLDMLLAPLFGSASGNDALLLLGQPGGTFAVGQVFAGGATEFRMVQIDRDPELELLRIVPTSISVFDRRGGAWVDDTIGRLPTALGTTSLLAVDHDGDGDQDLLLGGSRLLLANDGNGVFADVTATAGRLPNRALAAVDLDGDGDQDLLGDTNPWVNQQRQLSQVSAARVGHPLTLAFVADRGEPRGFGVAVPVLSLRRLPRGIAVLGGAIHIDPGVAVALPGMVSLGGRIVTQDLPLPADPALRGFPMQFQGLAIDAQGRLWPLNHVAVVIE